MRQKGVRMVHYLLTRELGAHDAGYAGGYTTVGIVEVSPVGLVPHRRTHLWIWASVAL